MFNQYCTFRSSAATINENGYCEDWVYSAAYNRLHLPAKHNLLSFNLQKQAMHELTNQQ